MKETTDAEPLVVNGTGIKGLRTHDARPKTHESLRHSSCVTLIDASEQKGT